MKEVWTYDDDREWVLIREGDTLVVNNVVIIAAVAREEGLNAAQAEDVLIFKADNGNGTTTQFTLPVNYIRKVMP